MLQLSGLQAAAHTAPIWDGDGGSIAVRDPAVIGERQVHETVDRFYAQGYAVLDVDPTFDSPDVLGVLAHRLRLGEPFVPPIYASGHTTASAAAVTRISATLNAGAADGSHPSFGTTAGQALHVDGTLQDIGFIKSSLLMCAQPADEGGATILFNAAGAFRELLAEDPDAARAMTAERSFVREANLQGYHEKRYGPGFGVEDGRLVTRYAAGPTDRWVGLDDDANLRRGATFLADAARPGSPHYREFSLRRGQVILLSNAQICHGRTPYRDSPTSVRCMYRSLHLLLPPARR